MDVGTRKCGDIRNPRYYKELRRNEPIEEVVTKGTVRL